jgi:thiol-disulfide isomerase/thioredoxin
MMDATDSPPSHQPRPVSYWVILAALAGGIFLYVALVTRPGNPPRGDEGPAVGHPLAYLQLEGLTGDARRVALEDLRGRVTLLNYWGTWCPPCIQEFPHIVELARKYSSSDDFRLYAVSCGTGHDESLDELRAETESFLESRQASLPTYSDQHAASRTAMVQQFSLGDMAYPTTLILDRAGVIRGFWIGYDHRAPDAMESLIEDLLAEPAPAKQASL